MKNFKRIIAVLLCVCMLSASAVSFASAEDAGTTTPVNGKTPTRISVTVNGSTTSSRGFCWYTNEKCDTQVKINNVDLGTSADFTVESAVCEEWEGKWMHKVVVSGLQSGKSYMYTVGDGTVWSYAGMFKTDDADGTVKFINVADVQAGNLDGFKKGGATVAAALREMPDVDFVSNCGDFTNHSTNEEWDYYAEVFDSLHRQYTLVPVSGNHDGLGVDYWFGKMFNLDESESVEVKTGVNYSFDYGNVHFAVLNTNDLLSVSNAQLKWLENDMNSTDKDWKIVFFHKSPYTLGKDGKWPDAMYLQRSLTKVLDKCNVDMAFSGHDHQYIRTKPLTGNKLNKDGVTYVLSGTAGGKRYVVREFLAGHFLNTDFIDALVIQRDGGNYWSNGNWDSQNPAFVGGAFETVEINDTTLTLNAYVLTDLPEDADENAPQDTVLIDTYTVTKESGENKITFTGDNTTSESEYKLGIVPSFLRFAAYTFGEWLPKFLGMVPALLKSVIVDDVF